MLQVSHAASSGGSSSLSLGSPVVRSHFSSRVSTRRAGLLLHVERTLTASLTKSVGLAVTFTERWSTFTHSVVVVVSLHEKWLRCEKVERCTHYFRTPPTAFSPAALV